MIRYAEEAIYVQAHFQKDAVAWHGSRDVAAVAGDDVLGCAGRYRRAEAVRTALAHGLHVHAERSASRLLDTGGRWRRLRVYAAPEAAGESQERISSPGESLA